MISYGDTRFTDPSNVIAVNPKVRRWLVQRIADEGPDAILLSGDLPYTGSDPNDYTVFLSETKSWRDRQIHFYPALGNHELKGGENAGLSNWWRVFPELNRRRWYSVAFRNAYFICIDTDALLGAGSEQRAWFDQQLTHLPAETRFVFVVQHHPPIADLPMDPGHTPQANEIEFSHHLEEQAANLPVRFVVIAGHIHNYERFEEKDIDFLVSGGGGAKPHPVPRGSGDFYKDLSFPNYHYVKFAFDGKRISASMIRLVDPEADKPKWEEKDRFVIEPIHRSLAGR
ncbi:MAG TPA: metallophosphoesterase [Terriglobales bacterium]|nr:metallophosphoesterase [Terriglobales bacterium]